MAMNIKPLNDKILVKEKKNEEKVRSGIVIPGEEDSKDVKIGTVIEIGSGRRTDNGEVVPISVKKGQEVIFTWGEKFELDGEEFHIISESGILGVLE